MKFYVVFSQLVFVMSFPTSGINSMLRKYENSDKLFHWTKGGNEFDTEYGRKLQCNWIGSSNRSKLVRIRFLMCNISGFEILC